MEKAFITKKLIKLDLVMKLHSRQKLSELGLYFGQIGVIGYIKDHPHCTQVDVANAMSVSPASIALSTKRLEKSGFIIKEIDENNLRCKRLRLTEKGESVAKRALSIRYEQDVKMYNGLTQEELDMFDKLVDKVTMNLTEENENIVSKTIVRSLEKQIEDLG